MVARYVGEAWKLEARKFPVEIIVEKSLCPTGSFSSGASPSPSHEKQTLKTLAAGGAVLRRGSRSRGGSSWPETKALYLPRHRRLPRSPTLVCTRILPPQLEMAPAPNAFSNELGKWICQEFRGSILFVELTPRDPAAVKSLWDKITPIPEEDEEQQLERVKESQKIRCSTGFIIKDADGYIQVLTCAHVMGDLFNAANPITARRLGQLFSFRVLCDHREMRFKRREDQSRVFCNARVNRISCQKDLLLLSVTRQHFEGYCNQPTKYFL